MNAAEPFEAIVSAYYQPLFRFAISLTRAEADAWDLTQHTFYIWAAKGHQLRDRSKVKTWLFTTLHRAYLNARRRQGRFSTHEFEEFAEQLPAPAREPADHADNPRVLAALARVDEIYQAAVSLFYLDECSYREIAAILEVPIGTVKSRIARGMVQLKNIFLSNDSLGSSPASDGTTLVADPNESAEPSVNPPSLPATRDSLPACPAHPGLEEWDLSSTCLLEPLGRA